MRRIHLFEFEDLAWFPKAIRDAGTDLLRFNWELGVYKPIVPRLRDALVKTGSQEILDLGSGGAGPAVAVYKELVKAGCTVRLALTDKFPNLAAFKYARDRSHDGVDFMEEPVDATAIPSHLTGFRTLFATAHHFRPDMVRRILQDAVDQGRPIGIFDLSARTPPPLTYDAAWQPPGCVAGNALRPTLSLEPPLLDLRRPRCSYFRQLGCVGLSAPPILRARAPGDSRRAS